MAGPPTGTVTFLFTDIEGSTAMWERDARRMQLALARHDEIIKDVIGAHGGFIFKMVGDACCAAFAAREHPGMVQRILGHSSIVQTMDTYSHLVPGMADDAAERFGGYLFGSE